MVEQRRIERANAPKPKLGRPPAITPQIAEVIFSRIIEGRTVYSIAKDNDVPSLETIYQETHRNAAFAEGLARARKAGSFALAESVVSLADAATDDNNPQRIKNQCDQRRWLAGKYNEYFADKPSTAVNIDMTMGKVLAETLAVEPPTVEHQAPADRPSGKVEHKD
jgi:hypothetical protein